MGVRVARAVERVVGADRVGAWRIVRRTARRADWWSRRYAPTIRGAHLVRAGVSVKAVAALLGHTSLSTTAIYVAVDRDDLRAAVERLPGTRE